jgi:hypothetical protein
VCGGLFEVVAHREGPEALQEGGQAAVFGLRIDIHPVPRRIDLPRGTRERGLENDQVPREGKVRGQGLEAVPGPPDDAGAPMEEKRNIGPQPPPDEDQFLQGEVEIP